MNIRFFFIFSNFKILFNAEWAPCKFANKSKQFSISERVCDFYAIFFHLKLNLGNFSLHIHTYMLTYTYCAAHTIPCSFQCKHFLIFAYKRQFFK